MVEFHPEYNKDESNEPSLDKLDLFPPAGVDDKEIEEIKKRDRRRRMKDYSRSNEDRERREDEELDTDRD